MSVHSWKHDILVQRICDLKDVPSVIDGVRYFHGGVDEEIKAAIRALEGGDEEEAERWCVEAEWRTLRRYDPGFRMRSHGELHHD